MHTRSQMWMLKLNKLLDTVTTASWISSTGFGISACSRRIGRKRLSPFGIYEWPVMPFDLTKAPATFQAFVEEVLGPLRMFLAGLLDDIAIGGKTIQELLTEFIRSWPGLTNMPWYSTSQSGGASLPKELSWGFSNRSRWC